jgi:tRNA 2-thiouridine synthesizing protein E
MGPSRSVDVHGYTIRVVGGRELLLDEEGFLVNPEDWTEDLVAVLAGEAGITELTDRHWKILRFIRDFYLENGRAPLHREARTGTGLKLMEIERLFPGGIRHGARRLAGLPNPKTC